eukprot:scaffold25756_cov42-Cyclotella_meneghiniana.AAC.5
MASVCSIPKFANGIALVLYPVENAAVTISFVKRGSGSMLILAAVLRRLAMTSAEKSYLPNS